MAAGVEVFLDVDGVAGATDCAGVDALLFAVDSRRSRADSLLFTAVSSDMIVVAPVLEGLRAKNVSHVGEHGCYRGCDMDDDYC